MGGESAFSHDPLHPPTLLFQKKSFSRSRSHQERVGLCCFPLPQHLFSRILLFFARHLFCVRPSLVQQHSHICAIFLFFPRDFFSPASSSYPNFSASKTSVLFPRGTEREKKCLGFANDLFFLLFLSSSSSSCISPLFCQRQ